MQRAAGAVPCLLFVATGIAMAQAPDSRVNLGSAPGAANSDSVRLAATDDHVVAVWRDQRNGALSDIYCNHSADRGESWPANDQRLCDGAPGSASSVEPRIVAAAGLVHVVWREFVGPAADVHYRGSFDGGATFLPRQRLDPGDLGGATDSFDIELAAEGPLVAVVWSDSRHGQADILCNCSSDGGLSWLPTPRRLDSGDLPGASASLRPTVTIAAGIVHVAWEDGRSNGLAGLDVYATRSLDGGLTWSPDQRLDGADALGAARSMFVDLAAEGGLVAAVWQEQRSGGNDVHTNVSTDGGLTWAAADTRLDLGSVPGAAVSEEPRVAVVGGVIFAAWRETTIPGVVNPDVAYNRSTDGGVTWQAAASRLDDGFAAGASDSREITLQTSGLELWLAWSESGTGNYDILVDRSFDGGATWLPAPARVDSDAAGAGESRNAALAIADGTVQVAWRDRRNSQLGRYDIYNGTPRGSRPYGSGTPGTGGLVPIVTSAGAASPGGQITLAVQGAVGAAPCVLFAGLAGRAAAPLPFGTLWIMPPLASLWLPLGGAPGVAGAGAGSLQLWIPANASLVGTTLTAQAAVLDAANPAALALTGGLEVRIL